MIVYVSWAPGAEKLYQWRILVAARAMDSTSPSQLFMTPFS